jgi:hypothetical protein
MKLIVTFFMALLTMTSFTTTSIDREVETAKLAQELKYALQHESPEEYLALFPKVEEFYLLMEKNGKEYGPFLKEAQEAFGIEYTSLLVPVVYESFERLLKEGKDRGINWSKVSVAPRQTISKTGAIAFDLVAHGKTYSVILEKPLWINGQLKVNQFVKLV